MKNFFDSETPLMRFLSTLGDLIIINFLFLVCSIPIVTIGASLTASYKAVYSLTEHSNQSIPHIFFTAFRGNFKESLGIWCGTIVCFFLLGIHLLLIANNKNDMTHSVLFCVWFFAIFCVFALLSYTFPLIARYHNYWYQHLRNAALLAIGYFPRTIALTVIHVFPFLLLIFVPALWFYLIPFWLLFGFAGIFRLDAYLLKPIFSNLEQKNVNTQ